MSNIDRRENRDAANSTSGRIDAPGSSARSSKDKRKSWKTPIGVTVLVAFGIVALIFLFSFVSRNLIDPPVQPEIVQGGKAHVIQLDVLNGTGTARLGQRFTDYLRARGFDVVEMSNYKDSNVSLTRVIDRVGNAQAAHQVARALGVPKERVAQGIDRHAYLDVTVVIGKDFRSLKPMQ